MTEAIRFETTPGGVLVATMDLPGRTMNVVGDSLVAGLATAVQRLAEPGVVGLVLTSGKADFCAGGDIERMARWTRPDEAFEASMAMKAVLRQLERQGKPVVAAVAGHALGGGLEIALACHARFALDDPGIRIGQPEVRIGLLPGGGGTVRLSRLLGIEPALRICTLGADMTPQQAQAAGLLTGLAADRDELMRQAQAWIAAHPAAQQPWDAPKYRIPGGDSRAPAVAQVLALAPSVAAARDFGNYPAVRHIMSSIFEGGLLDFEAACTVESRYFAACAMSQVARNMIGTLWFQMQAVRKGASRPAGEPASTVSRLGVIGAGMMGAGIAAAAARAGIDCVLLDTTEEAAERGRSRCDERWRARIQAAVGHEALAGCDLVIEAVFEDRAVKAEVTRQAEAVLGPQAVMASNTSTLPITSLARASQRPASFVGLHFFSPVHRMPLVEIIAGAQTSPQTLARAFDFVRQIGKTPIVVNDARGFYTSRVFGTYLMEGLAMLAEGVHPRSIEAAGLQAGMPMPPLALQDEVSLSLSLQVAEQTRLDLAAEGRTAPEHPGLQVVRRLCGLGRTGRQAGQGFYDWPRESGGDKRLWPGLAEQWPQAASQPEQAELVDRLMFVQANEAARCLEEGVLRSVADANVGSILGWGFAPFHGGALQFVNAMGAPAFVRRARALAERFGPRFEPAAVIVRQAESGGRFEDA